MKKYLWIFILLVIIIGIIMFFFNRDNNNDDAHGYIAERTDTEIKNNENGVHNLDIINETKNIQVETNKTEEKIAEFSTKLPKDTKARENNIKLACKKLNGTIVKKDETFSFWEVLGCPKKENGYEKAKTFTADGKVTKAYGGGLCQVSTTIYNAVLKIKKLDIKERHEHSRDVPYIKDGKDAAVSYNEADLKFKNELDYDIRIEAKVEENKVKIKLVRI